MLSPYIFLFVAILKLSSAGSLKRILKADIEVLPPHNGSVRAGCPEFDELPKVWNSKFLGIRYYWGAGHDVPGLSCTGGYYDRQNGFQYSHEPGSCTPFGSIFVHAGCTFNGFCEIDYEGHYQVYEGPLFVSKVPMDTFCGWFTDDEAGKVPCAHSFTVDCKQHYPDCAPSDQWKTVASFDNTNSDLASTFTYKYVIGTSWSTQMSEGMSIDATISEEMSVAFFEIFEAKIGFSVTTGYNWNEVSTEAKSETREFWVQTDVPAGKLLEIQQAKGTCGGSEVNTEMFRSLTPYSEGNEQISYFKHI